MVAKKTEANVFTAFVGEAKAYFRLMAFAKKAEQEGYHQIALLFKAISIAESVHARHFFELMEKVGTTEENLKYSFEQEEFVSGVAYPEFIKQAWAEDNKPAIWWFTAVRNADERHAKLYKQALTLMVSDKTVDYYVCTHCGWIEENQKPDRCPNCQKGPEYFTRVG